jgi:hypothetical protein
MEELRCRAAEGAGGCRVERAEVPGDSGRLRAGGRRADAAGEFVLELVY